MTRSRILVKSPVGEFANDWDDLTDEEIVGVREAVDMLYRGELAYLTLYSGHSIIIIPEELAKKSVILIQSQV